MITHREELIEKIRSAAPINVDPKNGLSTEQVENQKKEGFDNKTKKSVTKTYWRIFCDNVFTFFNIVYFVIIVLMVVAGMDVTNYFFCLPVLCNMLIGLFTDIHTRHLVDKLRLITDPKALVVRDGEEKSIPVNQVVLNDIMIVSAGEQICADSIVVSGRVEMDESLLTGESINVSKGVGDTILSATYVKSGKAYVKVCAVGSANYAESVQTSAKQFKRPNSELKSSCLHIFLTTGIVSLAIGILMTISWLIHSLAGNELNYDSYKSFIPSLSGSMIAMIPAGLYLLVSLALAVSVGRLARKKMNVQELYCVEMLAKVDVICFDKTGTITDGELSLVDFDVLYFARKDLEKYIYSILKETGDFNATAKCLLSSFEKSDFKPIKVLPFNSDKKYAYGYFDGIGSFIYGAPEFISGYVSDEQKKKTEEFVNKGFRVLGVYFSKENILNESLPSDLKMVGIITLGDRVKSDARSNIEWFVGNGVDVKIISGDNAATVSYIAHKAGVPNADKYISMESVSDEEIQEIAGKYAVFGRVKPEQKAKIIAALQDEGHKVAMTGDGVNDILALKKADCSIAMGNGSSAARNVAHIVSVDNDFSKLPDVVSEGRRAINNLQRSASLFLAKTIFAITLSFIFLISQSFGKISYPFSPKNLYVWEIITIGGGGFFLALQKTNDRIKDSFMHNVLRRAIPSGVVQILAVIIVYSIAMFAPDYMSLEQAKMISVLCFTVLSYCVLARVSWKFDLYRGSIFGFLSVSGIVFFLIDYFCGVNVVRMLSRKELPLEESTGIFGLNYNCLDMSHWILLVSITIGLIAFYALLTCLDVYIFQKKEKKS